MRQFFFVLIFISLQLEAQELIIQEPVNFLALGDSYTIGQSVNPEDSWPRQLASRLSNAEVRIIATTGWTTGDLLDALDDDPPEKNYNLVSLLIGVNNQFQKRGTTEYSLEFRELLNYALFLAGNRKDRVFVLSIPDYEFTPYGSTFSNVSEEIDLYNSINQSITESLQIPYISITDISRRGLIEPDLVSIDGLHPSGKMYSEWVDRIMQIATISNIVTGIEEDDKSALKLYPNPANKFVSVEHNGTAKILVYNIMGQMMYEQNSTSKSVIDISQWNKGAFIISIQNNNLVTHKKFIKN